MTVQPVEERSFLQVDLFRSRLQRQNKLYRLFVEKYLDLF